MKNKIVVWGTNAANEKILIALELKAEVNKVLLYTFPESVATEEFFNKLMNEWKTGTNVEFPAEHTLLERELSVTDSLLPDDLKVEDRNGLIQRAQTEWHFAVLSSKLHQAYQQELADFKEKVQALQTYDASVWDSLRGFWDKVQDQARDRNLYRNHADNLRDNINALFDDLKKMRTKVQDEFLSTSQSVYDDFITRLEDVEQRIAAGGAKLNSVFDDLKNMQRKYREAKMGNEHRNKLWDRLDKAFKKAKERRFGPSANEGSLVERHERRVAGLRDAIRRMEDSVRRDEEELAFQSKKIAATEGQLEAQIRSAKIKMIEERVSSKREKLDEMNATRADVERQMNIAKEKETKRIEKEAERKKFEEAKAAAKKEISEQITAAALDTPPQPEEPKSTEKPQDEENTLDVAGKLLGESFEDMLDTVKAVGKVLGQKAGDMLDEAIERADDLLGDVVEKVEEVAETLTEEHKKAAPRKKAAPDAETPAPPPDTAEAEKPAAKPRKKAAPKKAEGDTDPEAA
ncbi:MAG: hypothetical protein ABMA02_01180 [Saprospiraceae bacterium]